MTAKKLVEQSVLPITESTVSSEFTSEELHTEVTEQVTHTLTKRELFAYGAMNGLLSNPNTSTPHPENGDLNRQYKSFSEICVEYADAMLEQLAKEQS